MIPYLTSDYELESAYTHANYEIERKRAALNSVNEVIDALYDRLDVHSYSGAFDVIEEVRKKKYDEWKIASENYDVAWEAYKSDCARRHKEFNEAWIKEYGEDTLPF